MSINKKMSEIDDLDLRLVRAWSAFRSKVSEFIEKVDECTVDLHFESSLDSHTHFRFEPDDAVFISDIEISNGNKVTFLVPHGSGTKSFFYDECELIAATLGGEKKSLLEYVTEMYKDAFKDVPEAPTITMLERKYLATNPELRELLNNSDEAIKQYNLNIERGQTYSKLDDYGMF